MDMLGDRTADLCPLKFDRKHRHDSLRNVIASQVAQAAGLDCQLEAPLLVTGTQLQPADILIRPPVAPRGRATSPAACDITVISLFRGDVRSNATRTAGVCTAEAANRNKVTDLERKPSRRPPPPSEKPTQTLNFEFQPLAFDYLGSPVPATVTFFEGIIPRLAEKQHTQEKVIRTRI